MNQTIESLNQTIDSLTKQIEALTLENKILQDRCYKAEKEAGNLEYFFSFYLIIAKKNYSYHRTLVVEQTKSGWLNKKSPNETFGQKFQKRFFVLKYSFFFFFLLTD